MPKSVLFDWFAGTGSVSAAAHGYDRVYSLDWDPDTEPDFVVDILDETEMQPVLTLMRRLRKKGDRIAFHGSPPCEVFSCLATAACVRTAAEIERAVDVVEAFLDVADKYAHAWCLENPATGSLWEQERVKERLTHRVTLDYCAYGGLMRKRTGIAFGSPELLQLFGPPRLCAPDCPARIKDVLTGTRRHANISNMRYQDRIRIPQQLAWKLAHTLLEHLQQLPPQPASKPRIARWKAAADKTSALVRFEGSSVYVEMSVSDALYSRWASVDQVRAFSTHFNEFAFDRILKRDGDMVLIKWRDFPKPEWQPAANMLDHDTEVEDESDDSGGSV